MITSVVVAILVLVLHVAAFVGLTIVVSIIGQFDHVEITFDDSEFEEE